jgi:ATP-dependent RNA helicase DeaD
MDTFLKFTELNISDEILRAVEDMGFEEPTPIQQLAIPLIMNGRDVTGQAQTGTGKTAAFAIPVIEKINAEERHVQAMVLSPTRELTIQIAEEFNRLLKYRDDIRVLPIYGGQDIERQISALKRGIHIVVGTPGRVMDHLRRRTLTLNNISTIVLDEADQMLDMGFKEDLEEILEYAPDERQTILFSATMPKPILRISKEFQTDPEFLALTPTVLTVPSIEQLYIEAREKDKLDILCRLIDINGGLSMIFCNTKKRVDEISSLLHSRGYFAEGLHGDMNQSSRDRVMNKFRSGSLDMLIATDVAARGIDVDDIDTVYNYDVPQDAEYYIHRIGRTGRAGKTGRAYTFVGPRETAKLRMIQKLAKAKIRRVAPPSIKDVENCRIDRFLDKLRGVMRDSDLTAYIAPVEKLMDEDFALTDIAAALIKVQVEGDGRSGGSMPASASAVQTSYASYDYAGDSEDYGHDSRRKNGKNRFDRDERSEKFERFGRDERRERGDRRHDAGRNRNLRREFEDTGAEPGMVRFFINVGKSQGVKPKDIVGAIAGEAHIAGKNIGAISILNDFSFVEIPMDLAQDVHRIMNESTIRGYEISFEPARKNDRR